MDRVTLQDGSVRGITISAYVMLTKKKKTDRQNN